MKIGDCVRCPKKGVILYARDLCTTCYRTDLKEKKSGKVSPAFTPATEEPKVIASKEEDRPLTKVAADVVIVFYDNYRLKIEAGAVPRVVENGLLMVVGADGTMHHFPIAGLRTYSWKIRKEEK